MKLSGDSLPGTARYEISLYTTDSQEGSENGTGINSFPVFATRHLLFSSLVKGRMYLAQVRGRNTGPDNGGWSPWSSWDGSCDEAPPYVRVASCGVVAIGKPGPARAVSLAYHLGQSMVLQWNAPADDGSGGSHYAGVWYELELVAPQGVVESAILGNVHNYSSGALVTGTAYTGRVRAMNAVSAGEWAVSPALVSIVLPGVVKALNVSLLSASQIAIVYARPAETGGGDESWPLIALLITAYAQVCQCPVQS